MRGKLGNMKWAYKGFVCLFVCLFLIYLASWRQASWKNKGRLCGSLELEIASIQKMPLHKGYLGILHLYSFSQIFPELNQKDPARSRGLI